MSSTTTNSNAVLKVGALPSRVVDRHVNSAGGVANSDSGSVSRCGSTRRPSPGCYAPGVPTLDPLPTFDLYSELGVPYDADVDAIERGWRNRVRKSHPDLPSSNEGGDATARTARLNIARDWLTDPAKRARYDYLRRPAARDPLPVTDPLAPWPNQRSHTTLGRTGTVVPAILAVVVLLATVIVGIGTSVITVGAFAMSLIMLVYFGLLSLR